MMHFVLCLSVVGRPAARCASWPVWIRWTVFRCFWLLFHTFSCEGGPRILRLLLRQTHGFSLSPSYSAATCSVLYVAEECTKMRIFHIQRLLARQWIHVCVSVRVGGRLCLATDIGTHSANCACSSFVDVGGCATLSFGSGYMYCVSWGTSCAVLALRMALVKGRG